jgi:hypothetical protein
MSSINGPRDPLRHRSGDGRVRGRRTCGVLPGVPQLLAGWLWLSGYAHAIPSAGVTASAYLAACLAGLLFQTTCVYGAARMISLPPVAAELAALVACATTAFRCDFALPMSETLITYLLVFFPILAARMLRAKRNGAGASVPRLALFTLLIVAAAILTQWRASKNFHSVTLLGVTTGLVLLAGGQLTLRWRVARSSLWLLPLWLLALGQIMFLRATIAPASQIVARPAAFDRTESQCVDIDGKNE